MSGFVSFVGSGPGDPELLTVKAVKRLKEAEAVLYDDLSASLVKAHAAPGADLIGVGKRAGRPSPKQNHVSQLLLDYAQMGLRVVRLKSGDPGIFGRLEEEITVLREADIPFEIIPGVTSAAAAAASAMIPLTRRLSARRLQFITGHDISGGLPDDLNLSALADAKATTAVFMPKRTFPALAKLLMDEGLPGSTPAILAENVSLADEEVWRGTVESLAARLADDPGSAPAIIIYGTLAD